MHPGHFIKLEDLLLPLPLPAILAVLMVAGLGHLGWRLALRLRGGRCTPLDVAAGFVVVAGLTGAVVHGLAVAQVANRPVLRAGGWGLALAGAYHLARFALNEVQRLVGSAKRTWEGLDLTSRAGVLLAIVTAVGLLLAALGPPTDADSLDYHLGVPLDWLRHGGAYPRPDWFTARLVGLGEALNMLGLASGTDVLGAALQASGLVLAAVAVATLAKTDRARVLAIMLTVTSPVMLFLVPNQKPQLLPAAATTVALVMLARAERLDPPTLLLAFGSAGFAMACKYSFMPTAGIVLAAGVAIAWRQRKLGSALIAAIACIALEPVPVWARNWAYYGDPLSPFLERLRPGSDPAVVAFATYLRELAGKPSFARLARLGVESIVTLHPGAISTLLGVGVLAAFTLRRFSPPILLGAAIAAAAFLLAGGQLVARFFLEPYLWVCAAVVAGEWNGSKTVLSRALLLQGAVTAAIALFGAVRLFPGALSPVGRERVMTANANDYAATRWMDQVLPANAAVIAAGLRSHALYPRPFVVAESIAYLPVSDGLRRVRVCELIRGHGVTDALVAGPPEKSPEIQAVPNAHPVAGPVSLRVATRNPWNAGATYLLAAYDVSRGCR